MRHEAEGWRQGPGARRSLLRLILPIMGCMACVDAWRLQPGVMNLPAMSMSTGDHQRGLLSGGSNSTSAEKCLTQNLYTVLYSCPQYNGSRATATIEQSMRDSMIKLLQSCVLSNAGANSTQEPMRMLMPTGLLSSLVTNLTNIYQATTTIPIEISLPASYSTARLSSIQNAAIPNLTHEMWLITPSAVGDGLAANAFMDLSDLVLYDQRLQWQGLINQMRSVGLIYGSKVVALPLSSYSFQLFYQMESFTANNWTVPRTWNELVDLGNRINGTDDKYGFCGWWSLCGQLGTNLVKYLLATYHQTHGATQGWLIDPENMKLMLDSPAVEEALNILRALYRMSPPDTSLASNCIISSGSFQSNKCHMTIAWGTTFKWLSYVAGSNTSPLHGNLGVASLPGSERVLDRATNTLVPCDAVRCPYASWHVHPNGTGMWVNTSPGFETTLMTLNAQSSSTMQFYSYSVGSYLARASVNSELVFDRLAEVLPARTSQLQPARWQAAGYNLADATRYCSAHALAMSHPNLHVQARIPGASSFVSLFGTMMTAVMGNGSISEILTMTQPRGLAILNTTFRGNQTRFKLEYWSSINRVMPSPPPAQPPPVPPSPPVEEPSSPASGLSTNEFIIIVICTIVPIALVVVAVLLRMRWVNSIMASSKVPGIGPNTTLLVTDIEGSTSLWEELDGSIMDTSIKLHDACMRRTMLKHKGYESVWEGDSFVVAFPTVAAALNFSLEVQKALLTLDWPVQLLTNPRAEEVWLMPNKSGGKGDVAAIQAALHYGANSSTVSRPAWGTGLARNMLFAPTTANTSFAHSSCEPPSAHKLNSGLREGSGGNMNPLTAGSLAAAVNGGAPAPKSGASEKAKFALTSVFRTVGNLSLSMPLSPGNGTATSMGDTPEAACQHSKSDGGIKVAPPTLDMDDDGLMLPAPPRFSAAGALEDNHSAIVPNNLTSLIMQGGNASYTEAGPSFLRTLESKRWPLRSKWAHKWQLTQNRGSSATVVFRGLRVRIGFHAGVTAAPEYNKSSRRYLYSGSIRIVSNVVAFSGHGGFIMMSNTTAQLLGLDSHGVLRGLPSDCHVYHMGNHTLADVEGDPMELLLVLPAAMRCLLALQQAPLRSLQCVVPGVLDAPAPPPTWAAGLLPEPVLVAMQTTGLQALLAWNKEETFAALTAMVQAANAELVEWSGIMSEDGLTLIVQTGVCDQSRLTGAFRDHVMAGRMVTAFHDHASALRWALSMRHRLLTLDWSDKLLAHEMCEQVGHMPTDQDEGVTLCAYRELSMATDKRQAGPDVSLNKTASKRHVAILQAPSRTRGSFLQPQMSENGSVGGRSVNHQTSFGGDRNKGTELLCTLDEQDLENFQRSASSIDVAPPPMPLIPESAEAREGVPRSRSKRMKAGLDVAGGEGPAQAHVCLQLDDDVDPADHDRHSLCSSYATDEDVQPLSPAARPKSNVLPQGAEHEPGMGAKENARRLLAPMVLGLNNRGQSEPAVAMSADAVVVGTLHTSFSREAATTSRIPGSALRVAKGPASLPQHSVAFAGVENPNRALSGALSNRWPSMTDTVGRNSASGAIMQTMATRSMGGQSEPTSSTIYAFDAQVLRGPRVKMAVVSGPSSVHIATGSSGRATFRGASVKQLYKLLQQARTGQVLVAGNVMQQGA